MKNWIGGHKFLSAIFAGLLVLILLLSIPWTRGALLAHFDQLRGHDEIKTYGYVVFVYPDYERLLKDLYGIEYYHFGWLLLRL